MFNTIKASLHSTAFPWPGRELFETSCPLALGLRSLFLLCAIVCVSLSSAQVTERSRMPRHPRLLLQRGQERRLMRDVRRDSTWSDVHKGILGVADAYVQKNTRPVEYILTGRRLLGISREALRRIIYLGYAYRTTGNIIYNERARTELSAIAAFTDWHPSHFLDVAEMTLAAAIGYDWFYAEMPDAEREALRQAIIEKGLRPSITDKEAWYITTDNNWGQVVHAGMVYGAIAVWESDPQMAAQIVNRAIKYIIRPMEAYGPDGAYPEGCGYWDYGTTFNVLLLDAFNQIFSSDFGLTSAPGFMQTGAYITHMCSPALQWFAYSDNGNIAHAMTSPFWFYRQTGDESILFNQKRILYRKETPSLLTDRLGPCAVIWGHSTSLDRPAQPSALSWYGQGRTPVYTCRSSWTYDAAFLGMKGGSPSTNHSHMDQGEFIYESEGIMWAADLGTENYNNLEQAGMDIRNMKQNSQRWSVYRYGNRQHNTLTFNNQDQIVQGAVRFTQVTNGFPGSAVVDLTPVYEGQVKSAQRRCSLHQDGSLSVEDHVETLPGNATQLMWTMVTPATVSQTGSHTLRLTCKGKAMNLNVEGISQLAWQIGPATPPHDFENPNRGFTLIHFTTQLPAEAATDLKVTLSH